MRSNSSRLTILALAIALAMPLRAANPSVIFSTDKLTGQEITNLLVTFQPLSLVLQSNRVVTLIPFTNRTDYLGNFTNTIVPGQYRVTIADPRINTVFTNCIPDTNATIYITDYICVAATNQFTTAYTKAQSDARYAYRADSVLKWLTNGTSLASSGITNVNFSAGVTGYVSAGVLHLGVSSAGGSATTNSGGFSQVNTLQFSTNGNTLTIMDGANVTNLNVFGEFDALNGSELTGVISSPDKTADRVAVWDGNKFLTNAATVTPMQLEGFPAANTFATNWANAISNLTQTKIAIQSGTANSLTSTNTTVVGSFSFTNQVQLFSDNLTSNLTARLESLLLTNANARLGIRTNTANNALHVGNGGNLQVDGIITNQTRIVGGWGSSTATAYSFTNKNNYGITYDSAGDAVEVWVNGTRGMRWFGTLVESGGTIRPPTTATYDLGTTALLWRNAYFTGNGFIGGTLTVSNGVGIATNSFPAWATNGIATHWNSNGTLFRITSRRAGTNQTITFLQAEP